MQTNEMDEAREKKTVFNLKLQCFYLLLSKQVLLHLKMLFVLLILAVINAVPKINTKIVFKTNLANEIYNTQCK